VGRKKDGRHQGSALGSELVEKQMFWPTRCQFAVRVARQTPSSTSALRNRQEDPGEVSKEGGLLSRRVAGGTDAGMRIQSPFR
jgi:hypothetical protein